MRTALVTTFHDTVNICFDSVLETMGTSVRDVVHGRLTNRGIPPSDISTRFDDMVEILYESFGGAARVIVYKTMVELYQHWFPRGFSEMIVAFPVDCYSYSLQNQGTDITELDGTSRKGGYGLHLKP